MQYGIRLRHEADITWAEFYRLLKGIMPETPLGQIVAIRSEKDSGRIKNFTAYERKIRAQWRRFRSDKAGLADEKNWDSQISALQDMLKSVFL